MNRDEFLHFSGAAAVAFLVLMAALVSGYGLEPLSNPYSYLVTCSISIAAALADHIIRRRRNR